MTFQFSSQQSLQRSLVIVMIASLYHCKREIRSTSEKIHQVGDFYDAPFPDWSRANNLSSGIILAGIALSCCLWHVRSNSHFPSLAALSGIGILWSGTDW